MDFLGGEGLENIIYNIAIKMDEIDNKRFRYFYKKSWRDGDNIIIAILLNPSKATLTRNDKTVDILTEFFLNKYGGIIILNLFSLMCSKPTGLANKVEEYEKKNRELVIKVLNENLDKDFFIGWGMSFAGIKNSNIINEANSKKQEVEKFFKDKNLKEKVFCFRSPNGRALHPSKYSDMWTYDKYFKR